LGKAERKKEKRYRKVIQDSEVPMSFIPFAVSSFGNMGKKAKDLLKYLAVTIADHELISPHVVRQQIVQQIVSAVMRPVADAISVTRGFERT